MNRRARHLTALLALVLVSGGAQAETAVDAYGLGAHPPEPEIWTKIDEELSVRARILTGKRETPAAIARAGQVLRLDLAFYVQPWAPDRDIRLACSVYFYNAEGERSGYVVEDNPCYNGRLHDGLDRFQPVALNLKLRPRASDPAGTSAVVVRVQDSVIGDGISLSPTYDWTGGL
jgi:hypothetical protein